MRSTLYPACPCSLSRTPLLRSDTFASFLTGSGIPVSMWRTAGDYCPRCRAPTDHVLQSHITALPREVLATPFGQMIAPMLTQTVGQTLGNVHQPAPGAPARPQPAAASAAASSLPGPTGLPTRCAPCVRQDNISGSAGCREPPLLWHLFWPPGLPNLPAGPASAA